MDRGGNSCVARHNTLLGGERTRTSHTRALTKIQDHLPVGMVILCLQVPKDVFPNYQYMTLRMIWNLVLVLTGSSLPTSPVHSPIRQGERSAHVFRAAVAHAVDLSAWQTLQAFGIFKASVVAGVTK